MRAPSTYGCCFSQASAVLDVAQLALAEVLVERPRRLDALPARRPVVADPDDDAVLGEELVIHVLRAAPRVVHHRRVRPAVGELVDRIAARRIEVGRLDHLGFHHEAVPRLHLQELGLRQAEVGERRHLVLIDRSHLAAVALVEPHLGRRRRVAPCVDVVAEIRAERGRVRAVGLRQALQEAAVEPDSVHVAADRAALGAGEVDPARCLVDAVQGAHFPRPVGHLFDQVAVGRVVIDVLEAGPLAQPEKRSVLQPDRVVLVPIDPRLARLAEDRPRGAAVEARRRRDRAMSACGSARRRRPAGCPSSTRRSR